VVWAAGFFFFRPMLSAAPKQQKTKNNLQTLAMMPSAAILVSPHLAASILHSNQVLAMMSIAAIFTAIGLGNDAEHCDLGIPPPGS
jgi:hypothetical protein